MADIWRLLSFFGLGFVLFAVFANLSGIDVGQAIKNPNAADWMQAIGALGTFFVAIVAFQRWRRPDDTKRRADAAQELIRLSAQLEAAALSSRSGGLTVLFGEEVKIENKLQVLKEFSEEPPTGAIERLIALQAELVARDVEIETLFGDPVLTSVKDFLSKTQEIIHSHEALKQTAEPIEFIRKQPKFEAKIDTEMQILGVRVISDSEEAEDWDADEFGDELRAGGLSSRKALAKFLIGT